MGLMPENILSYRWEQGTVRFQKGPYVYRTKQDRVNYIKFMKRLLQEILYRNMLCRIY